MLVSPQSDSTGCGSGRVVVGDGEEKGRQKTYYNGRPRAAFIISKAFARGRHGRACHARIGITRIGGKDGVVVGVGLRCQIVF